MPGPVFIIKPHFGPTAWLQANCLHPDFNKRTSPARRVLDPSIALLASVEPSAMLHSFPGFLRHCVTTLLSAPLLGVPCRVLHCLCSGSQNKADQTRPLPLISTHFSFEILRPSLGMEISSFLSSSLASPEVCSSLVSSTASSLSSYSPCLAQPHQPSCGVHKAPRSRCTMLAAAGTRGRTRHICQVTGLGSEPRANCCI